MKVKIKIMFLILIAIVLGITTKSNAGLEIKPGGTVWTSITVSESYEQCYNLRNADSTLGNNSLDPHLILNKDWGAVAYLSASSYGAVTGYSGPTVAISGVTCYTTTGNPTGVMDLGRDYTQTSGLHVDEDGTYPANKTNLTNNKGTKYVETLSATNDVASTKGQSFAEVWGWYGSNYYAYPTSHKPIAIRFTVFGCHVDSSDYRNNGNIDWKVTFRPAIWN